MSEDFEPDDDQKPDQTDLVAHLSDQIEALSNKVDALTDLLTEFMASQNEPSGQSAVVDNMGSDNATDLGGAVWQ